MSKKGKLIERFKSFPNDFTWDELVRLLGYFGYKEYTSGKTGGSRRKFINDDKLIISLHKPHPGNIVKRYVLDDVFEYLSDRL